MSRLTVRLPDSLHAQLVKQADREGVSLNHYIVFSLTRTATATDLETQAIDFQRLKSRFPAEEAEQALRDVLGQRS